MTDRTKQTSNVAPDDDPGARVNVDKVAPTQCPTVAKDYTDSRRYHKLIGQVAERYVEAGFRVMPLQKHSKFNIKGFSRRHAVGKDDIKTVRKWFDPDHGKYRGYNIGIVPSADTVVVADLDRHRTDADGIAAWEGFTGGTDLAPGPIQLTPRSGQHRFIKGVPELAKIELKLPGVDWITASSGKASQHIVAYPSVVSGQEMDGLPDDKFYQYVFMEGRAPWEVALPPFPPTLLSKVGGSTRPLGTGRGNEEVSDDDVETPIPIDQVKRLLSSINLDQLDYSEWLRIGQSIHTQHPGDEGFTAWDDWSKHGDRYKPNECHKRWTGFRQGGSVRMGTLIYYAQQHGWKPTSDDVLYNPVQLAVEGLNESNAWVKLGEKDAIIVEVPKSERGPYDPHYGLVNMGTFHRSYPGQYIELPTGKKRKVTEVWLDSKFRRSFERIGLYPPGITCPPGTYNTWNGFAVDPIEGDCSLILNHIKDVICSGRNELNDWVLDWFAALVQQPGRLCGTALIIHGGEGTGKSTVALIFRKMFGFHQAYLSNSAHVVSNFNSQFGDSILTVIEEPMIDKKMVDILKSLVTDDQITIERKGYDRAQQRNCNHLMTLTNREWAVPAAKDSRRWCVIEISGKYASNRDYFAPLYEQIENGGIEAFLHYLLNRKITSNLQVAPETPELRKQRQRSLQSYDRFDEFASQLILDNELNGLLNHPSHGPCLLKDDVYERYRRHIKDQPGRVVLLSKENFWAKWEKIFPSARGGKKYWPQLKRKRVALVYNRVEMARDFSRHSNGLYDDIEWVIENNLDWESPGRGNENVLD